MYFCDKNITNGVPKICNICNVILYSTHCQQGHKLLWRGHGSFGWKCLKYNKLSYRYGRTTTLPRTTSSTSLKTWEGRKRYDNDISHNRTIIRFI